MPTLSVDLTMEQIIEACASDQLSAFHLIAAIEDRFKELDFTYKVRAHMQAIIDAEDS